MASEPHPDADWEGIVASEDEDEDDVMDEPQGAVGAPPVPAGGGEAADVAAAPAPLDKISTDAKSAEDPSKLFFLVLLYIIVMHLNNLFRYLIYEFNLSIHYQKAQENTLKRDKI